MVKVCQSIFGSLLGALTGQHIYDSYFNTKLELHYQKNSQNESILEKCPTLLGHFYPSIWSCCALAGLLYANLFEHQMLPLQQREMMKLKDGGQLALDWRVGNKDHVVVIAHGLTRLVEAGFTCVCVNQRGVAFSQLITPRYHNHGDPADLKEAIELVKKRYPTAKLYGIGISIGGNLMTKYAGLVGEKCPFEAIVSIANPFDLNACSSKLNHWSKSLYQSQITENFKWLLEKHRDIMYLCTETHGIDIDQAFKATTPEEFDHHFTVRLFSYPSVEEMYRENSCLFYIDNITVPMLFINAKNDPICEASHIPYEKFYKKPNLILALTQKGGHIEWFKESNLIIVKRVFFIFNQFYQWIMDPTIEYLNTFR